MDQLRKSLARSFFGEGLGGGGGGLNKKQTNANQRSGGGGGDPLTLRC